MAFGIAWGNHQISFTNCISQKFLLRTFDSNSMSNVKYIFGGVLSLKCKEKANICQVKDDFLEVPLSNQNANKKK